MTWPTHPMVQKPCEVCGEIMECTQSRKVCTKCRRKREDKATAKRNAERRQQARKKKQASA